MTQRLFLIYSVDSRDSFQSTFLHITYPQITSRNIVNSYKLQRAADCGSRDFSKALFEMKRLLRRYRRQKRPKTQGSPDAVVLKPRQVRRDQIVPQTASLEGVAVEIQQAILRQMPDLQALRALISASPSYLSAYRSQRHSIMSSILLRDIHPDVLFDALAIVDALKLPRNYDDYVPQLKAFVEQYQITRTSLSMTLREPDPWTSLCSLYADSHSHQSNT